MILNNKKKIPYYIVFFSIFLCLAMGIWWLYLLSKLANILQTFVPNEQSANNMYIMIIAEGSTFFLLSVLVLISTFFLLRKEQRKIISLQKFYAIFSHELKTPLTTLQLQIEILPDLIKKNPIDINRVDLIIHRLQSSSIQLKHELEKMLTLSQLELSPALLLESIDLSKFISHWLQRQDLATHPISLNIENNCKTVVNANQSAIETIFNNLFRNTLKHSKNNHSISIHFMNLAPNQLVVTYKDQGTITGVDKEKLGNLFYKSKQSTGSGLGLFIINQMMNLMNGSVSFKTTNDQLTIELYFKLEK